jgi:hypothetical protein
MIANKSMNTDSQKLRSFVAPPSAAGYGHYPHAAPVQVQPASGDIVLCLARQLAVLLRSSPSTLVPTEYAYVPTGNGADRELVSDFELSLRVAV